MGNFFQVYGEATLVFPLLVGETFAKHYHSKISDSCSEAQEK